MLVLVLILFFFFQAEDGIRDYKVTGVQTCALPIYPELADRTYIEPITLDVIEQVIQRERPDALLPTMGGQIALNAAVGLAEQGILKKYGVPLIGASYEAIRKAENRDEVKPAVARIRLRPAVTG